jgi:hypothetical protein
MKTIRELINLIESAQALGQNPVAEGSDDDTSRLEVMRSEYAKAHKILNKFGNANMGRIEVMRLLLDNGISQKTANIFASKRSIKEQGVAEGNKIDEGSQIEREIARTQALIQDYYNRARASKNDIKRDHYIVMARQLEYELDSLINDANEQERDGNMVAQHDATPSATWNRGGLEEQGVAEGDVIPFKRPESKIKPEVRRVFIRHLLDQGYTNDEISRMNDQQFTKAYYGIKGKTKVKDVRPNWTDDLPDELDEEITPEAMAKPKIQVKEQGVAEGTNGWVVYNIRGRIIKNFADEAEARQYAKQYGFYVKPQGVAEGATVAYEVEWTDKNTGEQGITTVSALTSQDAADKLVKMKLQQLDNVDVTDVFPAHKQTTDKEQGVAEALSKTDLLKQVSAKLNDPKFRKKPVDPTKSFTKGDHWQGAKPGDYGYTGYQGHGMPTDRAERARIRADKKKQQDK